MSKEERGAVLIIVVGVLAVFFILGVAAILISSSGKGLVEGDRTAYLARSAAESSIEVCRCVLSTFRSQHSNEGNAVSGEIIPLLEHSEIDRIVRDFENSQAPISTLRQNADKSIFNLTNLTDASPLQFSGSADSKKVHGYAYLKTASVDSSDIDLTPPEDTTPVNLLGAGKWLINAYAWGLTSSFTTSILPADSSAFAFATLEVEFKVRITKQDDDTYMVDVFFPTKWKLLSRRFCDRTLRPEFTDGTIPWPFD